MWGVKGREYPKGVNVRTMRRRGSKNQRWTAYVLCGRPLMVKLTFSFGIFSFNSPWNHYKIWTFSDDLGDSEREHREQMGWAVTINEVKQTNL